MGSMKPGMFRRTSRSRQNPEVTSKSLLLCSFLLAAIACSEVTELGTEGQDLLAGSDSIVATDSLAASEELVTPADSLEPDHAVADPDVPPGLCLPGARRCTADISQVCDDSGQAWLDTEVCQEECYEGWCALVLEGQLSGETVEEGKKVILRGPIAVFAPDGIANNAWVRIRAAAIVLEGDVDATGVGAPGGGGGGGGGGGSRQAAHGNSAAGGDGASAGSSGGSPAGCGSEKYGAEGGAGGAGAGQWSGAGGTGGQCNQPDFHFQGIGGAAGQPGGYGAPGVNGDQSLDDQVWIGSGGGGGGGGSGGGNGNGEGGGGGGGGGAGGAGGGSIELIASHSLVITGSISANGLTGGDGTSGTANQPTGSETGSGGDGGAGANASGTGNGTGGQGGPAQGGGTKGGQGGAGGPGSGGGILLRCDAAGGLLLAGSVSSLGGSSAANGGTVKVQCPGASPQGGIVAGRICVNGECGLAQTGPVVVIISPADGSSTEAQSVSVSGTVQSGSDFLAVEHRVNNGSWTACAGGASWNCQQAPLSYGQNIIEVRATDGDGLTGNAFVTVRRPEPTCQPSPEVCDGQDNDCDNQVDEDGVCDQQPQFPSDFAGVVWLHKNVSGWAQTANMASVTFNGGQICLNYDKANAWQGVQHVGHLVNANPWIFVYQGGTWYGATWEWMKVGQTCKNKSAVAGDHIKQDPLWDFSPVSGKKYYFMVSGLARDAVTNVSERSNVVEVVWP